jgi:hypothetical protein
LQCLHKIKYIRVKARTVPKGNYLNIEVILTQQGNAVFQI